MRWGCFLLQPHEATSLRPYATTDMKAALKQRSGSLAATLAEQERVWGPMRRFRVAKGFVASIAPDCSQRAVRVPAVAAAPRIDGALDDACWKTAPAQGDFRTARDRQPARYATVWRAVRLNTTLYLGIQCDQDMTQPAAHATTRDGRVWRDDSVEVFINALEPVGPGAYLQLIVNPQGAVYDAWRGNRGWNGTKRWAVQRSPKGWSLEVALPLQEIGIDPASVPAARVNVVRNVVGSAHNAAEMSSWFPSWDAHADFRARGTMVFTRSGR